MKRALMTLSMSVLHAALRFPDDVRIVHVWRNSADFSADQCTLYLEGDSLPWDGPEGAVAPYVVAEYLEGTVAQFR